MSLENVLLADICAPPIYIKELRHCIQISLFFFFSGEKHFLEIKNGNEKDVLLN